VKDEVLSDASGESSDVEKDSVEHSELTDDDDDNENNADDDSEWEDVDEDECVTDTDECEPLQSVAAAADNNQCSTEVCNSPDVLTSPQLIKLFRALCHDANSHADVHTVGLVCI